MYRFSLDYAGEKKLKRGTTCSAPSILWQSRSRDTYLDNFYAAVAFVFEVGEKPGLSSSQIHKFSIGTCQDTGIRPE